MPNSINTVKEMLRLFYQHQKQLIYKEVFWRMWKNGPVIYSRKKIKSKWIGVKIQHHF